MNFRNVLGTTLVITIMAGAAIAQQFEVKATPGEQPRIAQLSGAPELRLSLQDAVETALRHNINLEVSRLRLASSGFGIVSAAGVFDPYTRLALTESASDSPATNQLVGAQVSEQKRRNFDLSLGQPLPTGGVVELGWSNVRTATNSTFYFLNPSYNSSLTFALRQPLLYGFGTDINRAGIEIARGNLELSRIEFEGIVIATIEAVENAYWNLVAQRENLEVSRQSLALAEDLLGQTRTRVRIGTSAPIDIVQSEATVAAREQDIILAENAVEDAEDLLKRLLGFEDVEDWGSRIVPSDALEAEIEMASVDLDAAIPEALRRRIELRARTAEQQIRQIGVTTARNATLPDLDLVVNYGFAGVGGTRTIRDDGGAIIAVAPGGWDDSLRQVTDLDYPSWSAGLNFTYTFGRNQSRGSLAQRRFDLAVARQNMALERQAIIEEVRRAARDIQAGARSIATAGKARELAERNLDAEQKKFANGMSTNYQVLQIQEDLAQAQVSELRAKVSYRIARLRYRTAVGDMLESKGITLREQDLPREPRAFLSNVDWLRYGRWAGDEDSGSLPGAAGRE